MRARTASWSPKGSLVASCTDGLVIHLWHTETCAPVAAIGLLDEDYLYVSPEGHYGATGVQENIVYVAETDDGQRITLTPAEFEQKYGWKNDPSKVKLLDTQKPEGIEPDAVEVHPEPGDIQPGDPLSELALVTGPAQLGGGAQLDGGDTVSPGRCL